MVDFKMLQQQLGEQRVLMDRRQSLELETQKATQQSQQKAAGIMKRHQAEIQPLQENMRRLVEQSQQARKLADSGNFLDTLTLMGLQASNPAAYTQQGRQRRLAEDTALMSALNQSSNLEMQALEYESLAARGRLDEAKLLENLGAERLKMIQDEAAIMRGNFEAMESMKFGAMYGMGEQELNAAIAAGKASGGKSAINGIEIPVIDLEERLNALQERQFQIKNQSYLRALAQFDHANLDTQLKMKQHEMRVQQDNMARYPMQKQMADSQAQIGAANSTPEATKAQIDSDAARRRLAMDEAENVDSTIRARNAERKMSDARAANVDTSIAIERGMLGQQLQQQIRFSQQRVLKTMHSEELLEIQRNGYVDDEGNDYSPEDVNAALQNQMSIQAGKLSEMMGRKNLESFNNAALAEESKRVDTLAQRYPANSPLWSATQQYKNALGAASLAADSPDYFVKTQAQAFVEEARTRFMKTVDAQAKRDAGGDEEVAGLYADFYAGQPVQVETLKNVASRKIMAGKDISNLVPVNVAVAARRKYVERMSQKNAASGGIAAALAGAGNADDRKLMQQEAAATAFEEAVRENAVGRLDSLIGAQVKMPGHPLYGWSVEQMLEVTRRADDAAIQGVEQAMDLRPGELQAIRSGKQAAPEGFDKDQAQMMLNQLENVELISALNGLGAKGGQELLGDQVAKWWVNNSENYVRSNNAAWAQSQTGRNDFASNALSGVQLGIELDEMRGYAANLYQASQASHEAMIERQSSYMNFGGKPEYSQALLLQLATDLSDSDKALVYTSVIAPALKEAQARGLDFKATNTYVERIIMNAETPKDNKELATIMKTLRRTRGDTTKTLGAFNAAASSAMWGGLNSSHVYAKRMQETDNQLGWFRQIQTAQ